VDVGDPKDHAQQPRHGLATITDPGALTIEIRETPCRFIAASICAADCESSVGGDQDIGGGSSESAVTEIQRRVAPKKIS
jgi:hypothetical protein